MNFWKWLYSPIRSILLGDFQNRKYQFTIPKSQKCYRQGDDVEEEIEEDEEIVKVSSVISKRINHIKI